MLQIMVIIRIMNNSLGAHHKCAHGVVMVGT